MKKPDTPQVVDCFELRVARLRERARDMQTAARKSGQSVVGLGLPIRRADAVRLRAMMGVSTGSPLHMFGVTLVETDDDAALPPDVERESIANGLDDTDEDDEAPSLWPIAAIYAGSIIAIIAVLWLVFSR